MPKFAANLTMLFNEVGFLDRFAAAAQAGFKGVEYLFPYEWPATQLAETLDQHELVQVLHNLPAGDWAAGERGIACHPHRIDEFRDGVGLAIEYATTLGCRQLNCLAGIAPADIAPEKIHETLVANLRFAAAALEQAGIRLLIEPINTFDIPGFYLSRSAQAVALLDQVGSNNVFIQYDIYHAQRMEGELANTLAAHLPRIAHLQVADNPGRHEPGTGEINYAFLFDFIDRCGYTGWIGCEYKPAADTRTGLGWRERLTSQPAMRENIAALRA
jgi:hydroxypyruvate isomerase